MSTMGAGLIRPSGAVPKPPIDPNFVPILNGVPITGVSGIGPVKFKSGSRFAVRSPDLHVSAPTSLMAIMDWHDARYLGAEASPLLQSQLGLYYAENDVFAGTFRTKSELLYLDVPGAQGGGGSLLGRVKVDPGSYYIAGSFAGAGGAGAADYEICSAEPVLLYVLPVQREDVVPGFYTRRTAHKLSVFDTSTSAEVATTVWGEANAVTSVREDGTTVYIHSDPAHAAVTVHAANEVEAAGARKTASNEQVYAVPVSGSHTYGDIDPTITYGTAGLTY